MHACLRVATVLICLAAQAAAAEEFRPGPAPSVGDMRHLTEAEGTETAPRDRLEFGIGERVTLWIDRQTWKDVDLARGDEDQKWREVPDEMGLVIWSVDTLGEVYPTVGECTTFSVPMEAGAMGLSARINDSGQRGQDSRNAPRKQLAQASAPGKNLDVRVGDSPLDRQPGRSGPTGRGLLANALHVAMLQSVLQLHTPAPANPLRDALADLERRGKRTSGARLVAVEQAGQQLLARFHEPAEQGQIYYTVAMIAAQSGQIDPERTIKFAKAACDLPLSDDLWIRAHVYWGDALQVLDYGQFPRRRAAAATEYLAALEAVDAFEPKKVKPDPPARSEVVNDDGDDVDGDGGKQKFEEFMANHQARQLNETMQRHRQVVIGQLAALYRRAPDATRQLEHLAKCANLSVPMVAELMTAVKKPAPDYNAAAEPAK